MGFKAVALMVLALAAVAHADRKLLDVESVLELNVTEGVGVPSSTPKKVIIDTDPGIDDAMAILAALQSPEIEVIAITSTFGNVGAHLGAKNAQMLLAMANRTDIPVYCGSNTTLNGVLVTEVSAYVHGDDGMGNTNQALPTEAYESTPAAQFIVDIVNQFPGEIHILAVGPQTNLATALILDSTIPEKVASVVVMGGSAYRNGNINPAAEANIWNDAPAAQFVFGAFPGLKMIGLDVTMETYFTKEQVDSWVGVGPYGTFLHDICQFYMKYHVNAYNETIVISHDATALVALVHPEWFDFYTGAVVVATDRSDGFLGKTLLDERRKNWGVPGAWTNRTMIDVALLVEAESVITWLEERMLVLPA